MTLITATATKPSKDSKVGIAFSRQAENHPLTVKLIREEGLFFESELKAGFVVDSINGIPMTYKTPKDAADELRKSDGEVTIVAKIFTSTIEKSGKEDKVGISLKNSTTKPGMWISKINDDGKFAGSELAAGQKVVSINGVPCPSKTKEAIALVKDAESTVTVVAIDASVQEPSEPAEEPAAPVVTPEPEPVEEKKEDSPEETPSEDEEKPKDREAPATEEELDENGDKKGILDSMFSACIC